VLVIDASVLATSLIGDDDAGPRVRARLRGERLLAPELIDLEVMSTLRGLVRGGKLDVAVAAAAVQDLAEHPLLRASHQPLLSRCWELRHNVSSYDAAYVALAEVFSSTLVTSDARLATAPGIRCQVELVTD